MRRILVILAVATSLHAQSLERFLVPVYLPGSVRGAFGSVWVSELRILNSGSAAAPIENYGPLCPFDCLPPALPPAVSIRGEDIRGLHSDGPPAALLLVKPEHAAQFAFQLHVRDTSRVAQGWGTWLPVVHESQAVAGTLHLLSIPVRPEYRHMLRVYSFSQLPGQRVRVRLFGSRAPDDRSPQPVPTAPDPLLAEFFLDLRTGSHTQPAYAEDAFFLSRGASAQYDEVRIAVEPVGQFPLWAMVSITNNVTQEVTAILPNQR